MTVTSKDIEILWGRYQSEGVSKGVSVSQFFESNGIRSDFILISSTGSSCPLCFHECVIDSLSYHHLSEQWHANRSPQAKL